MEPGIEQEFRTLAAIRRFLAWTLAVGIIGTAVELLLLGHFEGAAQIAPLALLALSACAFTWHIARPGALTVRLLQWTMTGFVLTGIVGIGLHFRGNVEFERELYPSLAGIELVEKTMTGATPVFAPGSLMLLGLVGLAYTYRHPQSRSGAAAQEKGQ
jgi:hypothetical protein